MSSTTDGSKTPPPTILDPDFEFDSPHKWSDKGKITKKLLDIPTKEDIETTKKKAKRARSPSQEKTLEELKKIRSGKMPNTADIKEEEEMKKRMEHLKSLVAPKKRKMGGKTKRKKRRKSRRKSRRKKRTKKRRRKRTRKRTRKRRKRKRK